MLRSEDTGLCAFGDDRGQGKRFNCEGSFFFLNKMLIKLPKRILKQFLCRVLEKKSYVSDADRQQGAEFNCNCFVRKLLIAKHKQVV